MKKHIGIWIDSEKALLLDEGRKGIEMIPSNLEEVFPTSGSHGITGIGDKDYRADNSLDRKLEKFRHVFYKELLKKISAHAEAEVIIIGPGEAKTEFASFLRENGIADRIKGVYPADKMTPNQLTAKFAEMFG